MKLPELSELQAAGELVHRTVTPTAQICWPLLSRRAGAEVWVKHENHTPIGAFKVRGGLIYMDAIKRQGGTKRVLAATRGNHGQSIAFAAARAGLDSTIVVPRGNSPGKNAAMQAFGAELIEHGRDFQEALEHALTLAGENGVTLVPSFDMSLAKGVASYALELLYAAPDLNTVYVPIGLGSGICGLISARDALGLKTHIVGVVSKNAAAYALSFDAGEPVSTNSADTIADGMACRVPVSEALEIIHAGAERIVQVSDEGILDAMAHYLTDTHNLAEGAGAAPLAALLNEKERMAGKKVGLILSGGNADPDLVERVLQRTVN
ncbi:MAG TPA: threonine dehydratase [Alphaproteobacteria bacterium]|nr:threonine dehydratase [Alphaproteobacteria bacterium]